MHWNQPRALVAMLVQLLLLSSTALASRQADSVPLSSIKTLTLRSGQMTSHRRVSAIPQLKCTGGSARGLYEPDTMRCTNSGSSYGSADVEWTCTASLPPEFKLGSTEVVCEGYTGPDDDRVLKGSCGVEYRLILTQMGEEKYGRGGWWKKGQGLFGGAADDYGRHSQESEGSGVVGAIFWVVFVGVILWMLWSAARNATGGGARRGGQNRGGWGGGGGGGGNDDPPPPYTPRPPPRKSYPSSSAGNSWFGGGNANQGGGWRPGFWTGAATGAAASYFAGNRGQRQQPRSTWGSPGYGYDPGEGSSRRYGGGGGSSSSGGYSATRYESTGFGSTRRR